MTRPRFPLTAMSFPIYSSDRFELPLPPGHRFPVEKYRMLRERVEESPALGGAEVRQAPAATPKQLLRVHRVDYVERVLTGTLSSAEERRIGLPWSPQMRKRSLRSTGATIRVCGEAPDHGLAVHLAGGTHHAFADRGEGYCVFNDVAVAVHELFAAGRVDRVAVVDLDVHQGNGTAALFAGDDRVFTFSVHGAANYPFHKERSDLDVALPDGTGDDVYLAAVEDHLDAVLEAARPDLVVYLAGADPLADDRLGRLAVSAHGLALRDRFVFERVRALRLPLALLMGGGYADPVERTVAVQLRTVELAAEILRGPAAAPLGG